MPVRPETSKRQNRFKIERNMLEEEVVKKFYGENELRRMYLEFFESKGHLKMNSFSLVPHNDNSPAEKKSDDLPEVYPYR